MLIMLLKNKKMSEMLNYVDQSLMVQKYDRKQLEDYAKLAKEIEELKLQLENEKSILNSEKVNLIGEKEKLNGLIKESENKENEVIKLKEECPNQDDLLELSEYVNTEYDNYFTVR